SQSGIPESGRGEAQGTGGRPGDAGGKARHLRACALALYTGQEQLMNILVLNSGSSTLKFQLIATDLDRIKQNADVRLCRGLVEGIGREAIITVQAHKGPRQKFTASLHDISGALEYLVRWIASDRSGITEVRTSADIHAAGHRVVHGGELFAESVVIT